MIGAVPGSDRRLLETESEVQDRTGSARLALVAFCEGLAIAPRELPDRGGAIEIGRAPECAVVIDHASVSRRHARVAVGRSAVDDEVTIEDLESHNGTRVRGVRIAPGHPTAIHAGDLVELGDAFFVLRRLAAPCASSPASLRVGAEAHWFEPDGAQRIQLGRRGPLRRLLLKLAEQALAAPAVGLSVEQMIAAGWPEERMRYEAGVARVYTSVQRLRALGLGAMLLTRDDGYLIDPRVRVELRPD